jgi:hypothetical protein
VTNAPPLVGTPNRFVLKEIRFLEMTGVILFVWIFNTTDAIVLSWCAVLKRDRAYTVLNVFWIAIGMLGIGRASGFLR